MDRCRAGYGSRALTKTWSSSKVEVDEQDDELGVEMAVRPLQGARLTALRHLHGLSQSTLASQLGVTQPFLAGRTCRTPVPQSMAQATASIYRVPPSFFTVAPEWVDQAPVTFRKKASSRRGGRGTHRPSLS